MIPKDMLANGESDKISDVINKCLAIRGGKNENYRIW